ncbi:MAG: SPOR domain-containing protein [Bacteroidetes bacterium]|nr:SPOR domain-containing protein [Bacteroidota bacterium]MDA1122604.1 SPOR domain-containing protein [Bacteroidota bacterium]
MSERSGKAVVIIVILMVVLAGAWYFFMYRPEQEAKEKARLEQISKEEAEKAAAELAEQNKAKYEQLIENADAEFERENWETANSLYTEASALFPDELYPQDQLALVKAKLDEMAVLEAKRAAGIVETVSSPTGSFYVIVSSSIDDDLAMDYARKLANEGNNVKIIEHNANKLSFYGVSVANYDTREQAESASASYNTTYNGVWVLKY